MEETEQMIPVALYERVSTSEQAEHGDSMREQDETLNAYAKNNNMYIVGVYKDEGISGQKNDRDALNRLMKDIRTGKIKIKMILFTKLDRWFRSMRHYLNTQEELDKYGISWKAVSQDYYDTSTAYGRTFVNLTMTFAELEAQNTSDRIKATFASKEANGEVISGSHPIGYKIENKHIVIDSETAQIAIDIFEHYDYSNSLNDTVRFLREKYSIRRSQVSLKTMLMNELYIGKRRENQNYCEPLIEKELFSSVQEKLKHNIRYDAKRTYLFTGLIYCAECGKNLTGGTKKSVPKKGGKKYTYIKYYCRSKILRTCTNTKTASENVLEARLIDIFKNEMPEIIMQKKNEKKNDSAELKKKSILKKIERLKDLYIDGDIDKNSYTKKKNELESELLYISYESSDLVMPKDMEDLILSGNFEERYQALDRIEKRNFWHSAVKKITLDKDKNIDFYF